MTDQDTKLSTTETKTIGSMMGEIVWLMSQSAIHKELKLEDLEWLLMPPLILGQYKIFRENNQPVGVALWGYLNEEAEQNLKMNGRIAPEDWGNGAETDAEKGLIPKEGGTLWLVELVAPFHTFENKHREQILMDLKNTTLSGKTIKLIHINPVSSEREEISLGDVKN